MACKPDFVSLAWVRALREAGAVAHARTLAGSLWLDDLLGARNEDPELLFVALEKACRPGPSRHPYAASPASDLRRVLTMITDASTPDAHARVSALTADVAEPTLREVLDAWLVVVSEPVVEPPNAAIEAPTPKHDESIVAPGIVRRRRLR